MASPAIVDGLRSYSPSVYKHPNPNLVAYSPSSFLKLRTKQFLLPKLQSRNLRTRNSRPSPVVFAAQSNFFKVIQTVWKVGRDGIEAATSMVPDSVPRPVARISVTVAALTISLFLLKSFLSTAFFALATMAFVYFVFIALNKEQGPRGGGGSGGSNSNSSDDPVEEARRIMEKYK